MKKQKLTSALLKLKKSNIANLNYVKGGSANSPSKSNCCSDQKACQTVPTRPDSLKSTTTTID
ncbi:MAG: hypothetical protein AB8B65_16790 [Kordia sp.]|uniref:hypothetical protein n=1 Tax=Kordia sp. TaxID=1965332 RepID=UPI00385F43BD